MNQQHPNAPGGGGGGPPMMLGPGGAPMMGPLNPNEAPPGGAHFLQQPNPIYVFSTSVANEAATAVIKGQNRSIIEYHRQLPQTIEFLKSYQMQQQHQHQQQQMQQQQQQQQRGPVPPLPVPNEQLTEAQLKTRTEKLGKLKNIQLSICPPQQQQQQPGGAEPQPAPAPTKRGRGGAAAQAAAAAAAQAAAAAAAANSQAPNDPSGRHMQQMMQQQGGAPFMNGPGPGEMMMYGGGMPGNGMPGNPDQFGGGGQMMPGGYGPPGQMPTGPGGAPLSQQQLSECFLSTYVRTFI